MSYYWFNRQEILQKAKDILRKKLQSILYKTKKLQKKSQESVIKTCDKKKKTMLKSTREKKYQELVQYKKEALKNIFCFFS